MKKRDSIKKEMSLFFIILLSSFCLIFFVLAEEESAEFKDDGDVMDVSKQTLVLDAIEKAEESVAGLKKDGLEDEYPEKLLEELKDVLALSDYSELINESNRAGRVISPDLMSYINEGIGKDKPQEGDYDRVIGLKGNILDRIDFIYDLKASIKELRRRAKTNLFWNGLSVNVDLSSLNRSEELFDMGRYDEAEKIFSAVNKEVELKSYQSVEVKKESLKIVIDCEKVLEAIEKEGFDDKVAKDLLRQTKDFFVSKNFYSVIRWIEDIDSPAWKDGKELLIKSNSSSDRPINEDYETLAGFKDKITERKEKLGYIKAFIDNLGESIENDKDIPELNTQEDSTRFDNVVKLFSANEYDKAFEEALSIEIEFEDKTISLIMEAKSIIKKLNSSNFTTVYLSDLLLAVYDKFSPFQSQRLLEQYKEVNDGEKLRFVKEELVPVKEAKKKAENGYNFIDFGIIIEEINEIKYREKQIYRIDESIKALSEKIEDYSKKGINTTLPEKGLQEAIVKLNNENYDDAESTLFGGSTKLELSRARSAVLDVLAVEGLSFLQKNKYKILISLVLVFIVSFYLWMTLRVKFLLNKINNLRIEKSTIENLIKKTQFDHYGKGKMPSSIYDIKYEEYTKRLNSIKAAIPIQEAVLSKQVRFNKKFEGWFLKIVLKVKKSIKGSGLFKIKRKKEGKKKDKRALGKGMKDCLAAFGLSIVLIIILYLVSMLSDSYFRYNFLVLVIGFFVVFVALLTQRAFCVPLIFLLISLVMMKKDVFDIIGVRLVYLFLIVGIVFILLFYILKWITKSYNTSVITSVVMVLSLMPIIVAGLISLGLARTSLYDLLNISLMNLFISLVGSLLALIAWYRFRTTKFMLRMGY